MSKRSRRHRNTNRTENKAMDNNKVHTNMENLDSALLERDYSYQRPVKAQKVKKIINEFDKDLVNILKVSYREGHYYVFDGSNTLEVLRKMNKREHFPVACKVYYGLSYGREAELFAKQNGTATKVSIPFRLRALEAAKDQETMDFLEATRSCGFEIEPGETHNGKNHIAAVCKAYSVYKQLGVERYKEMLTLLMDTWEGEHWSVSQNMLSGMSIFVKTFEGKYKRDRFINRLSMATKIDVRKEASKQAGFSAGYQYALAITGIYNRKGGKGALKRNKLTIHMLEEEDK